jgi:uncharacterized Zn-binding protein involved in type VI secretion
MPGPILHTGAGANCPHGAPLNIIAASPRVMLSGMPAAVLTDQGFVAGCPFTIPVAKPQPCVTTKWIAGATRVMAGGVPVLINPPVAICFSVEQIPAGPPMITGGQTRVVAV